MRRLIAIMLLVLLPIQQSWALVAAYCQHETGTQTHHFGHHDHRHQAGHDQKGSDAKLPGGIDIDNDCGTCHAGSVVAIIDNLTISSPQQASGVIDDYRTGLAPPPLDVPERPNWAALA